MSSTLNSMTDYLDAVETGLVDALAQKGIVFPTVEYMKDGEVEKIRTPALLIRTGELSPGSQANDGRDNEKVAVEIYCLLSNKAKSDYEPEKEIINLASFVKRLVNRQRWGLGRLVSNPELIQAAEADFKKGPHGFEMWVVTFFQEVKLGESLFINETFDINEVYLGINPESDEDYQLIGSVNEQ